MKPSKEKAWSGLATRRRVLGILATGSAAMASAHRDVLNLVSAMETRDGLTVFGWRDAIFHRWRGARVRGVEGATVWPAIAPDAQAMCWGSETIPFRAEGPFITVDNVKSGVHPVFL